MTEQEPRARTRLATRLIVGLSSLVLTLAVLEVVVRVVHGDRYGPRPGFYVADDETVWKPAANLGHTFYGEDFCMDIETDEHGHRLGELGQIPRGASVIVLSGDSHTFGWGVSTEETTASRLEVLLQQSSLQGVRVVNLGVGGYGSIQSAARLRQLVRTRPDFEIRGLVFLHCHNDMTDNADLRRLTVMLGLRPVRDALEKAANRSCFHLVNFLAQKIRASWRASKDAGEGAIVSNDVRDALWTFDVRPAPERLPDEIKVGRQVFRCDEFTEEEKDPKPSIERESLTPLQTRLMEESIHALHDAVADRGIPVYHTFIYTAPDWYVGAVSDIVAAASPQGNRIRIVGRIPEKGAYEGTIWNAHRGGHYTPDLNRVWAKGLCRMLEE